MALKVVASGLSDRVEIGKMAMHGLCSQENALLRAACAAGELQMLRQCGFGSLRMVKRVLGSSFSIVPECLCESLDDRRLSGTVLADEDRQSGQIEALVEYLAHRWNRSRPNVLRKRGEAVLLNSANWQRAEEFVHA